MVHVELTRSDGELIIVNFELVRSFYEDKDDDSTGGTILKFSEGTALNVKEPFAEICKLFKIATVKM
jgi:hypothetical protein